MFLALDKDMNGTLSKQELREYADGTLTEIFIERGKHFIKMSRFCFNLLYIYRTVNNAYIVYLWIFYQIFIYIKMMFWHLIVNCFCFASNSIWWACTSWQKWRGQCSWDGFRKFSRLCSGPWKQGHSWRIDIFVSLSWSSWKRIPHNSRYSLSFQVTSFLCSA